VDFARRTKKASILSVSALLGVCGLLAFGPGQAEATESNQSELNSTNPVLGGLEFRSLNGHGNNTQTPTWGEEGTILPRVGPTTYPDGVGSLPPEAPEGQVPQPGQRPNARYISNRVFNALERDIRSSRNTSQWVWTWGQFIDHDLDAAEAESSEAINIPLFSNDPLENFKSNLGFIPVDRSPVAPGTGTGSGNPRQFDNFLPSFLDGFDVYGGNHERLEWLRSGPDNGNAAEAGAELMLPNGYLPRATARGSASAAPFMEREGRLLSEPQNEVVTGDVRGNENAELTATTTLMVREHNRIVKLLPSSLSEEEKFEIAKAVVGAELQYITYNEFLPALGLKLTPYHGYNPNVNPSVALEFSTVGYRLHSTVNGEEEIEVPTSKYSTAQLETMKSLGIGVEAISEVEGRNEAGFVIVIPQDTAFFNPSVVEAVGLGPELRGLGVGPSSTGYRNDEQITTPLRSTLFQLPTGGRSEFECDNAPELSGCFTGVSDLGAIDVQRQFDHGTPSYNQMREAYGLAPQHTFDEVTGDSSEALPAGDTINTPSIMDFTHLENYWHEEIPMQDESAIATNDTRASTLAARLKAIYGSVENLDAFTGMVSEPSVDGELGELQNAILQKQFEAVRDGDRFFYQNNPALKTIEHKYGISYQHSLAELISMDGEVPATSLPKDVFFASRPARSSEQHPEREHRRTERELAGPRNGANFGE
jgi:hypothetical protein